MSTTRPARHTTLLRTALLLATVHACTTTAFGQVSVRAVSTLRWASSDGSVGLSGADMTVEDFEDDNLAPGLSVFWSAPAGTVGPVTTLPHTFNVNTGDPFGTAFTNGQWDGVNGLVSALGNQTYSYSASQNWGDVELRFNPPVKAVGFSMQQADAEVGLVVNGTSIGGLSGLTGASMSGGKIAYFVITAGGGDTISTLRLDNTAGDGFVIDHLLYTTQAAPVIGVNGFSASTWPRTDGEVGIGPDQIEDFEDVNLVPGLQVGWESASGTTPLGPTIPRTFEPLTQDPFGDAFDPDAWDGTHFIINTRDNASHAYSGTGEWGDVILTFNPPRQSVGFSFGQAELPVRLNVNGRDSGELLTLAGLPISSGRQGYIRIDTPCGGTPIAEVRLNNTRHGSGGDGFGIDHVTFGVPIGFTTTPQSAAICQGSPAGFSVVASGIGPFTYQWQIEATPGIWQTMGNDPGPLPGGGAAYAFPINSPDVHIGILNRDGPFNIRCIAANACASYTSTPARLFINPADLGVQGGEPGHDGAYDNNDFIVFINYFFANDIRADMGRSGGLFGNDGAWDNNDFIAFINQFFAGC